MSFLFVVNNLLKLCGVLKLEKLIIFCVNEYVLKCFMSLFRCQLLHKKEILSMGGRGRYCLEHIHISLFETLMCASLIILI